MKKVLLALFITTSGLYLSCKKDKPDPVPSEITGYWKLTETMEDIGNGKGKYIKTTGEPKYLILGKAGKVGGNALQEQISSFKVLDSARIEFNNQNGSKPIVFWYVATPGNLQLNPPCIEGCGLRFVKK